MLSIQSVFAEYGSVLILDASCTRVQVGLVARDRAPAWIVTADEAGIGLFRASATLLGAAGLKPQAVGAFILCDGPGSQLGIRTTAMAIRTWQTLSPEPAPVFTYRSLRLAAMGLLAAGKPPPFAVVCDARRECWHVVAVSPDRTVGRVERLPAGAVATLGCPLLQPAAFRNWASLPVAPGPCDYTCARLFAKLADTPLLEPAAEAWPWNPEPPDYKKWNGERHRAPPRPAGSR